MPSVAFIDQFPFDYMQCGRMANPCDCQRFRRGKENAVVVALPWSSSSPRKALPNLPNSFSPAAVMAKKAPVARCIALHRGKKAGAGWELKHLPLGSQTIVV
jgi:hypothetical protein